PALQRVRSASPTATASPATAAKSTPRATPRAAVAATLPANLEPCALPQPASVLPPPPKIAARRVGRAAGQQIAATRTHVPRTAAPALARASSLQAARGARCAAQAAAARRAAAMLTALTASCVAVASAWPGATTRSAYAQARV